MEYIFGTGIRGGVTAESVKVVSKNGTDLKGRCTIERQYADNYITDTFTIMRKTRRASNGENVFDWYEIGNHQRSYDKFTPGIIATEQEITEQELSMMEAQQEITDLDLRVMELEMNAQEDKDDERTQQNV